MSRHLAAVLLAAVPAFADPTPTKGKAIHDCHVVNSTDHEIGHTGIYPGESWWLVEGTFKTDDGGASELITIEAKGPHASVEIDGQPVALANGVAKVPFDARKRLLAGDPATAFTTPARGWRVPARVKASSGGQTIELSIVLDAGRAARGEDRQGRGDDHADR
jgi:hypothetical protein